MLVTVKNSAYNLDPFSGVVEGHVMSKGIFIESFN